MVICHQSHYPLYMTAPNAPTTCDRVDTLVPAALQVALGPLRRGGGDCRYLTHLISDIEMGGAVQGVVRATSYAAEQAHRDCTSHAWIAQEGHYLYDLRQYLFKPSAAVATLPDWLKPEPRMSVREVLIIDSLELTPSVVAPVFAVVDRILELGPLAPVVLLQDWVSFGKALGLHAHEVTPFLLGLGFTPIDGHVAALFRADYIQV